MAIHGVSAFDGSLGAPACWHYARPRAQWSVFGIAMSPASAKVDMTFVPYPGDAAAVNALLGEHVTSVFAPYPGIKEQLTAGNLRALATLTRANQGPAERADLRGGRLRRC
jgi:hypothetical protein